MSNTTKRRTHHKEFKPEPVRLVIEEGRKTSVVERNFGIGKSTIVR